jgi:hypothetical protein
VESHQDPTALYPDRTREAAAVRYPWWGLRAPHRAQDLSQKRVPTRFVLADRDGGHRADCAHLRRVSILHLANPPAGASTPDDPHHLVVCGLGAQSSRGPQESTRGLHEVD